MTIDEMLFRRMAVAASALVYWGGVWIQARRVRRHIGRSPNLKPQGLKEQILWLGWILVVLGWLALPLLLQIDSRSALFQLQAAMLSKAGLIVGVLALVGGYGGTLWCYAAMGRQWRIGIDLGERNPLVTRAPYNKVRHPIYSFQVVMLIGVIALLPALLPLLLLVIHLICVLIKASDEERYLLQVHGNEYRRYLERSGMLWPRWIRSTRDAP